MKTSKKVFIFCFIVIIFSFQRLEQTDRFIGKVVTEWQGDRKMKLLENFIYVDPRGKFWKAPKGIIIDGASIPQIFWTAIGGPFEGNYRNASVVHDYFCEKPYKENWQNVHKMFYEACVTGGVSPLKAKVMYAAVYCGGPRWEKVFINKRPGNRVEEFTKSFKVDLPQEEFKNLERWIELNNPDLESINDTLNKLVVIDNSSIEID